MHAQIVADALGVPYEHVEVAQPDTARVADSGPTVASRTCMVVGRILRASARRRCSEQLGELTPAEYFAKHGALVGASGVRAARLDRVGRRRPIAATRTRATAGAATSSRWRSIPTRTRCGRSSSPRCRRFGKADSSRAGARADRGRNGAGARLRAARGGRDARRRDGERAAHQLHHPDDARHAARSTS